MWNTPQISCWLVSAILLPSVVISVEVGDHVRYKWTSDPVVVLEPSDDATLVDTKSDPIQLTTFGGSESSPPSYHPDCDPAVPGGCVCLDPPVEQKSYFDYVDDADKTFVHEGGITVSGWFQANDKPGNNVNFPGQQTSVIFSRGKSSWKSGYYLGLDKWKSWRFSVIVSDANGRNQEIVAIGSSTAAPGKDWHFVVGTYDIDTGVAELYVDDILVGRDSVMAKAERNNDLDNLSGWDKSIRWESNNGALDGSYRENSLGRIGQGHDSNNKNFYGCMGTVKIHNYAVKTKKFDSSGSVSGDPHFKSWSGENYDFHGVCDLVLLHNPGFHNGVGMDIHIRTKQTGQWSYVSSAVLRIDGDTFEVMGSKNDEYGYWINGVDGDEILSVETMVLGHTIAGYPISTSRLNSKQREFTVDLGDSQSIVFKTWNDFVRVDIRGARGDDFDGSLGLMGTFSKGLKMARDRVTIISNPNVFGQEWQVQAVEPKLFHNREGPQSPEKCIIPSVTEMRRRLGETKISHKEAEKACSGVNKDDRDLCIFDVMATNDVSMADAY